MFVIHIKQNKQFTLMEEAQVLCIPIQYSSMVFLIVLISLYNN